MRVEVQLPTGAVLTTVARHVTIKQDSGRIASVTLYPSDDLNEFRDALAIVSSLTNDFGLSGSPKITGAIHEWSSKQPKLDLMTHFLTSGCLRGGVGVDFDIRPTMNLKAWSLSVDMGPYSKCPGAAAAQFPPRVVRIKFGDTAAQATLGLAAEGARPDDPIDVAGPARVDVELPTGAVLSLPAYHLTIMQDQGHIRSVVVFPSDQLHDFQDGVAIIRELANDFGLGSSPRITAKLHEWSTQQPEMDFFTRHLTSDCLPGGIAVDFDIRPTISMKAWSLSVDLTPFSECPFAPEVSQPARGEHSDGGSVHVKPSPRD
jgi:hypothetical protein